MGYWTRATPAMMCSPRPRSRPNSGPAFTRVGLTDAVGARASEPRQEPDTRRIEHVFGAQQSAPGGRIVRTIGMVRARAKIGLQKLAYNIRRLVALERLAAA